ncbi:MAG: hypothetical protein GQ570_15190 [Helicobacteraceae bacterium]|nr:hypothetical protein [Helicobacteraceae bacterium]
MIGGAFAVFLYIKWQTSENTKRIKKLEDENEKISQKLIALEQEDKNIASALERTFATEDFVREHCMSMKEHDKDFNILREDIKQGLNRINEDLAKTSPCRVQTKKGEH